MKKLIGFVIAASVIGVVAAWSATSTLWSTRIGDVVFPFSPSTIGDTVKGGMAPVNGSGSYTKNAAPTNFSYTFGNFQEWMLIEPAATIAQGYVTMAPAPIDGGKACVFSTQIISTLTWSANVGQTMNNAVTTLAANAHACYLFSQSNSTWDRNE
jgi:hypothetical protein